jgi:hypothetical protein
MRHMVVLVFDYTATEWAAEYGLTKAEAADDFGAIVRRAVNDGGLRDALDAAWPMMRGHVTAHTLDQLDAALRDELLHQLREASEADRHAALLTEIRGHLAAHPDELSHREPRWVIFHTDEWDNGYFLAAHNARVYFGDGDSVTVDFGGTCIDELLTDAYGARGSSAALGVDLKTAATEFDDYGDDVPGLLGIPSTNKA